MCLSFSKYVQFNFEVLIVNFEEFVPQLAFLNSTRNGTKLERLQKVRLAREAFNVTEHRLEMKTECVIRSAYFRATRRYAQWITKQEGIENETLDIKGLEFMKANFPPILGEFFNDILEQVLKGEQKDTCSRISYSSTACTYDYR